MSLRVPLDLNQAVGYALIREVVGEKWGGMGIEASCHRMMH